MIATLTDPRWIKTALEHFDELLVDHAHCEKKAAASAMALVAAHPDLDHLVRRLSALAIEEIRHFRAVYRRMRSRGLELGRDPGDPYVRDLLQHVRTHEPARLTDRLLVAGLIEARSAQRFQLLAEQLEDSEMASFYSDLARSEAGHAELFVGLTYRYGERKDPQARLEELTRIEAKVLASLPIEPRIH